ncbi:MAG: GNAT family N-acetyltransferase [Woeseiaceae bacterium]|nr:GNAT family N-acetyltransferase [Woeseiaceae bacterium]
MTAEAAASIRDAKSADRDSIVSLMARYYAEDGYPFDRIAAERAVADLTRDASLGCLWVVEQHGEIVGYLAVTLGFSLEYRGRDAFVDELYLDAAVRGQGLGRRLLDVATAYCRDAGVSAMHLEVETHRQAAMKLYEQAGFETHDRVLMTRFLDEGRRP